MAAKTQPATAPLERMKKELASQPGGYEQYLKTLHLASMGNMVGGVTHTLNNILGGILGYAQLLKEVAKDSTEALRHAEVIEQAAKRASHVVSQFQIISERNTRDRSAVDPQTVVQRVVTILSSSFNRNIKIDTHFRHESKKILANPTALSQVLLSVCLNAKSAMPHGGQLVIETELVDRASVLFKITDNGEGLDEHFLPYLFEPFIAPDHPRQESSLGLAIAREIIADHEGTIEVESDPERGSRYYITLPVTTVEPAEKGEEAEAAKQSEMNLGEATILVVDDEEELRTLATQIFERKGFQVYAAGNGEEAIELFREHRDHIHLVILDMILPGEDGPTVFKQIKKLDAQAKVILTSGYVTNSPFKALIETGSAMFVPKPWDLPKLVREAKKALQR